MPLILILAFTLVSAGAASAQPTPASFGGAYSGLDTRRQAFVGGWVERFSKVTGQQVATGPFYDDIVPVSTKTTFDAVTHALMTTKLTNDQGVALGDALDLLERVEAVRGEVTGAPGDHQFRIYVRLKEDAIDRLEQSKEFKRGVDNTVFHKGYPINYRAQGGTPSIQISIALDRRRADVDVDYRASSFPAALFNGHLTSSNSDVRAGNNSDRHAARWAGLQSWWSSFFGIRLTKAPADDPRLGVFAIPKEPRAGKKNIDVMVNDFLTAWLIEGDTLAAMSYVAQRSYACLAQNSAEPSDFDLGLAPFQLMNSLKAAHETIGKRTSLEGLVVGVRLPNPALKIVTQPYHAQFVITSVPDDVAAAFDCESRMTPGDGKKIARAYGKYFGATFFVGGRQDQRLSLLWARENGYWKIVSWNTGSAPTETPAPAVVAEAPVTRIKGDPAVVQATRNFLEAWLVRKDYDATFAFLSTKSYSCYDLERGADRPASTSRDDAGRRILEGLTIAGNAAGKRGRLDEIITAVEPFHPAARIMDHQYSKVFTLFGMPTALADAAECDARASGFKPVATMAPEYGAAVGTSLRFLTMGGEPALFRLLWRNEGGSWKITSYQIEAP